MNLLPPNFSQLSEHNFDFLKIREDSCKYRCTASVNAGLVDTGDKATASVNGQPPVLTMLAVIAADVNDAGGNFPPVSLTAKNDSHIRLLAPKTEQLLKRNYCLSGNWPVVSQQKV
jgi:hypothetical protein